MRVQRISAKKQALLDKEQSEPFRVGEKCWAYKNDLTSYPDKKRENETESVIILEINGGNAVVRRKDSSVHKDKYTVPISRLKKWVIETGANPFIESDNIRPVAYTLDSIIHSCDILGEGKFSEFKAKNGAKILELNWNPFIYASSGEKRYYQRGFVWTTEQKQRLIESIYQGIDCGKIVIRLRSYSWNDAQAEKGETELSFRDIVDGKQRLDAVRGFIHGEYPDLHGNYYGDLSYVAQNDFVNHQLFSYAEMPESTTDEQVLRQFLKMNHEGVPQSIEHLDFVRALYTEAK